MDLFRPITMSEPLRVLPEIWEGMRIALRFTGGVGDVVMALGGTALKLREQPCWVAAVGMAHQLPLMRELVGVDEARPTAEFNAPEVRGGYDVLLDYRGCFANSREFKVGEYFDLISAHIGLKVRPGKFRFQFAPEQIRGRFPVAVHPGASNPNRRWGDENWRELAWALMDRGRHVVWLGTRDEFGFNAEHATKLSDLTEDLVKQSCWLATCATFVGNDSGFAHVAGTLGVPGAVLFSVTHPQDVIHRYKNLVGVHAFDLLGVEPSRSLRVDDPVGRRCMDAISVLQVLEALDVASEPVVPQDRKEGGTMRTQIGLVGQKKNPVVDQLGTFLAQHYDVEILDNVPVGGTEYDVLIQVSDDACRVRSKSGTEVRVAMGHPENVRRAVREVMGAKVSDVAE